MNAARFNIVLILIPWLLIFSHCGGSSLSDASSDVSDNASLANESINMEKLVGTPFEGQTSGDSIPEYSFLCDQFRTDTITEFPIYIFSAFFTEEEENIIQEGVDLANEGIGFTAYELTNTWNDLDRVIYKVYDIDLDVSALGHTYGVIRYFNGLIEAGKQNVDWAIEITQFGVNKWTIAHELGHASGIRSHALIDYENDTIITLEDGSLMEPYFVNNPELADYDFMMSMQGQIMVGHLTEEGGLSGGDCDDLKIQFSEE